MLDGECQKSLRVMSEQVLAPRSTVAEFSVLWRNDEGISSRLHRDYLDELAWTAGTWLQEAVDLALEASGPPTLPRSSAAALYDELLDEVTQHWLTVKDRVRWFTGRKDLVRIVQSYVVSDDDMPLVLHGPSGIGKSSVIAKVAAEVSVYIRCFDREIHL